MTIRAHLLVAVCAFWTFHGSSAAALETEDGASAPSTTTQPSTAPAATATSDVPPARRGFQLALRTGYSAPFGDVAQDVPMSDWFRGQVPFTVDIGGKVSDYVFIGGFLGLSFGGVGDPLADICESCSAVGAWLGPEVLVSLLPAGKVDPWVGYGVGVEYNSVGGDDATIGFTAYVPLLLTGGVNFRISRVFGLGPFVGLSVARYSEASADDGDLSLSVEIDEKATHGWVTFGVRGVFFP